MPKYSYVGIDRFGKTRKGILVANNEAEIRVKLRFQGIALQSVGGGKKSATKSSAGVLSGGKKGGGSSWSFLASSKISDVELAVFTKQLATMLSAGVPVVQALDILATQSSNPRLRDALATVRETVEGGVDLATAFEKFPTIFDQFYVSLVRAGATAGKLEEMMRRLSVYIEKAAKLKKQLVSALSYPAIVVVIAVVMLFVMLVFVVPMFAKNYDDSGKKLPELTQLVIDMSQFVQNNFLYIAAAIVIFFVSFIKWKATSEGRKQFDYIMLTMPIIGPLVQKISIARFASTMSTLTSSGIAIPEALDTCAASSGNSVIEGEVRRIKEDVIKGKGVAVPMEKSPWFPRIVVGMVSIGEQTGQLSDMLTKIASFYEDDVDSAMGAALKMIEPIMFIVIGGVVGFILVAMYLPVFDLASTVG